MTNYKEKYKLYKNKYLKLKAGAIPKITRDDLKLISNKDLFLETFYKYPENQINLLQSFAGDFYFNEDIEITSLFFNN